MKSSTCHKSCLFSLKTTVFVSGPLRYIGALGARVICDNIPGLVNKQRQLCQRHPDIMQAIGEGTKEWIRECQHQFRHHRWNCSTLDRDHTVFGRVLLRSKSVCGHVYACLITDCGVKRHRSRPWIKALSHSSFQSLLAYLSFFLVLYECWCSCFTVTNGLLWGLTLSSMNTQATRCRLVVVLFFQSCQTTPHCNTIEHTHGYTCRSIVCTCIPPLFLNANISSA